MNKEERRPQRGVVAMLYLLIGFWLLGLLITWALVAIGGEPVPPDALQQRVVLEERPSDELISSHRPTTVSSAPTSRHVSRPAQVAHQV